MTRRTTNAMRFLLGATVALIAVVAFRGCGGEAAVEASGDGSAWEAVAHESAGFDTYAYDTARLRVPGGWLYRVTARSSRAGLAVTFVPAATPEEAAR